MRYCSSKAHRCRISSATFEGTQGLHLSVLAMPGMKQLSTPASQVFLASMQQQAPGSCSRHETCSCQHVIAAFRTRQIHLRSKLDASLHI